MYTSSCIFSLSVISVVALSSVFAVCPVSPDFLLPPVSLVSLLGIHQMGAQSEGGAVDGGSIIE